jgi:hypothetical protein
VSNKVYAANANSTNAPGTVKIGERILLVSDLTPGQYMTLYNECRRQVLAELQTPLQSVMADIRKLPPEFQEVAIRAAVAQQSGGGSEPTREAIAARMNHPEGVRFHVWLMARGNHPGLTLEEIVLDQANVEQVQTDLWRATHRDELLELQGRPGDPKGGAGPTG